MVRSLVLQLVLLMDKILHYPLKGIYYNSHSLESLRSCRILSINRMMGGPAWVLWCPEENDGFLTVIRLSGSAFSV